MAKSEKPNPSKTAEPEVYTVLSDTSEIESDNDGSESDSSHTDDDEDEEEARSRRQDLHESGQGAPDLYRNSALGM